MNPRITWRQTWFAALISVTSLVPQVVHATVVEFQTNMGNFEVNLYDNSTPATVTNFLDYVNNGDYTSSVIHRAVAGFVAQGGGFTYNQVLPLNSVQTGQAVVNEPVFSNVRGSIAMAKLGGDPNSATSQWFFNLSNNAANLDAQNGGFTVFGEVVGTGMDVVDAIAALPVFDFGGATGELPLRNYTAADYTNGTPVDDTHLVIINAIIVSDSTVDSAAGLNPPLTTNQPNPPTGGNGGGGGGGGGAFGIMSLLGLLLVCRLRIRRGPIAI
jgi:peptidyl-prolyl cis-trans isomerase A (cyclophilin A)